MHGASSARVGGLALLFGFVASQAARDVYLARTFGTFGLFEVAFLAFGLASVFFGSVLLLFRQGEVKALPSHWRRLLALNGTTAVAWLSYFGALRLAEPAAVNVAFCGIAPAAVLALASIGMRGAVPASTRVEQRLQSALLLPVTIAALATLGERAGMGGSAPLLGPAGVALASVAGVVITLETVVAKELNNKGISALAIVSSRFLLVTAIAGGVLLFRGNAYSGAGAPEVAQKGATFLLILVAPIYMAQAGLRLTDALLSSVILAISPVATLTLQTTAGRVSLRPEMVFAVGLYAVLAIAAAIASIRAVAGQTLEAPS